MADLYLPLKPRSKITLLNGMADILVPSGLIDRDYLETHTSGFRQLEQLLGNYTPEHAAAVAGLSEEQFYRAALLYGRATAHILGWTMGVNHSTEGQRQSLSSITWRLIVPHWPRFPTHPR